MIQTVKPITAPVVLVPTWITDLHTISRGRNIDPTHNHLGTMTLLGHPHLRVIEYVSDIDHGSVATRYTRVGRLWSALRSIGELQKRAQTSQQDEALVEHGRSEVCCNCVISHTHK